MTDARRLTPIGRGSPTPISTATRTAIALGLAMAMTFWVVAAKAQAPLKAGAIRDWDALALMRVKAPPLGLPPVPVPADNRLTKAKIALGRKLFFDRRLSINNTMSCAMCHIPEQGFSNNELATAVGVEGRSVRRNSPTSYNVAYARTMFHDARDSSLETQIFGPLLAHNEMGNPSIGMVIDKIASLEDYRRLFRKAFGASPNVHNLGQALASYQRTLLSANSPFDRWKYGGDQTAMSAAAIKGYKLFIGKAGCNSCHLIGSDSALFTDHGLHNTGIGSARVGQDNQGGPPIDVEIAPGVTVKLERRIVASVGEAPPKDLGRLEITDRPEDLFRYKTPMLRNVAITGPYMHDGSLRSLEDVVRFYNGGGIANPGLDAAIRALGLDASEVSALVAFLNALTGSNIRDLIADARSIQVGN